jgi:hypothetical protein
MCKDGEEIIATTKKNKNIKLPVMSKVATPISKTIIRIY